MPKDNSAPDAETSEKATFENSAPDNIPRAQQSVGVGGQPNPDLEDYDDEYVRTSDGESYALAIQQDAPGDPGTARTHKCMNTAHFWEGTAEQFRKHFKNKDGSDIKEDKPSEKRKSKAAKAKK